VHTLQTTARRLFGWACVTCCRYTHTHTHTHAYIHTYIYVRQVCVRRKCKNSTMQRAGAAFICATRQRAHAEDEHPMMRHVTRLIRIHANAQFQTFVLLFACAARLRACAHTHSSILFHRDARYCTPSRSLAQRVRPSFAHVHTHTRSPSPSPSLPLSLSLSLSLSLPPLKQKNGGERPTKKNLACQRTRQLLWTYLCVPLHAQGSISSPSCNTRPHLVFESIRRIAYLARVCLRNVGPESYLMHGHMHAVPDLHMQGSGSAAIMHGTGEVTEAAFTKMKAPRSRRTSFASSSAPNSKQMRQRAGSSLSASPRSDACI